MQTETVNTSQSEEQKTFLTWRVAVNSPKADYLTCQVFENENFEYKIKVLKNDNNKNAKVGEIIKSSEVTFNYQSPDGFTISYDDFATRSEAQQFYKEWKQSFIRQGYYSSNYGRIALSDLDEHCELIRNGEYE